MDVVISTGPGHEDEVNKQKIIADAAKRAGVKRFIPNDWATPCVRGVRKQYDQVHFVQWFRESASAFVDSGDRKR